MAVIDKHTLTTPSNLYLVEYPEAVKFAETQQGIYWNPFEIKVEKDVHDILTNLTEAERHGVITTLKLFTQYELIVGNEYWAKVADFFHKPACISRMATFFSAIETGVHAPFYSQINEALGLANKEFYSAYSKDAVLSSRMEQLEGWADKVDLEFLLMLALTEGVILYSSFAFLKHFQSNGKNKISNIVRGINFSARDENIHSEASSWLFRTWLNEIDSETTAGRVYDSFLEMVRVAREHEYYIISKIFEKGTVDGITETQMQHFVDSRINLVSRNLGFGNIYEVKYNPIAEWFYDGVNNYVANDFFAGIGREYSRTWSEGDLVW